MLSKIIENQKIDIQLLLHQLKNVRDILIQSMKKRKDMAIQLNESNFKEEDTTRLFDSGNPNECDVAIANLMQKNNDLSEEVRNLKRKHEIQSVRLFEEIELRKKVEDEKVMIEDDTKVLRNGLDEKTSDVQKLTNTQLEMMNKAIFTNQELMKNDLEIVTLKIQNEIS